MQPNSFNAKRTADTLSGQAADIAACRSILRSGSKSFFAASLLLPKRVRDPASALYAFCRLADDAVDLSADPRQALARIRYRLDRAYAEAPLPDPVDRAFAAVVAAHAIPRAVLDALFDGFAWDVDRRRYGALTELEAYAVRVAGTVGVMMTLLMGVRDSAVLARACDLGVAMQLTNIARDVGEDARAGRLYLPQHWLIEAGIDPDEFLRRPAHSAALGQVVARLLGVADTYYARANAGIAELPADCRSAIRAASLIYSRVGRRVAACRYNAIDGRAVVGKAQKVALIALAYRRSRAFTNELAAPAIHAARDLITVSAAARTNVMQTPAPNRMWRSKLEDNLVRILDLFERLERRSIAARESGIR
jgi:phytoene synthase